MKPINEQVFRKMKQAERNMMRFMRDRNHRTARKWAREYSRQLDKLIV